MSVHGAQRDPALRASTFTHFRSFKPVFLCARFALVHLDDLILIRQSVFNWPRWPITRMEAREVALERISTAQSDLADHVRLDMASRFGWLFGVTSICSVLTTACRTRHGLWLFDGTMDADAATAIQRRTSIGNRATEPQLRGRCMSRGILLPKTKRLTPDRFFLQWRDLIRPLILFPSDTFTSLSENQRNLSS
jgi:hypothetical protein